MLDVEDLAFAYGRAVTLRGVDVRADAGEIVTIIGPNGAGKTTLLNVLAGTLRAGGGRVRLDGEDLLRLSPRARVERGLVLVPEGRQVFRSLTVVDNLRLGGFVHRRTKDEDARIEDVFEMFPRLHERSQQIAGTLSGGEQQMLAIGRALMAKPRMLLLDEPSLGLAPQIVQLIMRQLATLRERGITMLLVEQNARSALAIADRGYLLRAGQVVVSGTTKDLAADPKVIESYLGMAATPTTTDDTTNPQEKQHADG